MPSSIESNLRQPRPRIGGPLRALLREHSMTQNDLALALGTGETDVSRWCRNQVSPRQRRVRQIAEYFDVPPAALFEPDDETERAA